jgi:bifunctional UDP-N-acetylglucosamine pyrophosphorylase/glucosamine-1-phosphate N-acetyltransferase
MLVFHDENPRGFGRIIRSDDNRIQAVVEEVDATKDQLEIKELNAGMYCFQADWLWENLKEIKTSTHGEIFLTDMVGLAVKQNQNIEWVTVLDSQELIGINTRVHLAEATKVLRTRINNEWMLNGVSLIDPDTTYIEPNVKIGQDSVIYPNTHLLGETTLGNHCQVGPDTKIINSRIGNSCEIEFSVIEESMVEDRVDIGPFSHLRKGAHLGPGVHVGNFGEIKESYLGEGTKVGHFAYIGNAQIGKGVNIGAGTVTCNYDGKKKHQTIIRDGVFIGSDSMLIAPLEIGENAVTGAGSVVNKDVPPNTVVVGIPARKITKRKQK